MPPSTSCLDHAQEDRISLALSSQVVHLFMATHVHAKSIDHQQTTLAWPLISMPSSGSWYHSISLTRCAFTITSSSGTYKLSQTGCTALVAVQDVMFTMVISCLDKITDMHYILKILPYCIEFASLPIAGTSNKLLCTNFTCLMMASVALSAARIAHKRLCWLHHNRCLPIQSILVVSLAHWVNLHQFFVQILYHPFITLSCWLPCTTTHGHQASAVPS